MNRDEVPYLLYKNTDVLKFRDFPFYDVLCLQAEENLQIVQAVVFQGCGGECQA